MAFGPITSCFSVERDFIKCNFISLNKYLVQIYIYLKKTKKKIIGSIPLSNLYFYAAC